MSSRTHVKNRCRWVVLSMALVVLVACGERTPTDASGEEVGAEAAVCEQYLDCVAATRPDELGVAIDAFGSEGSCWGEDIDCAASCEDGLDLLRSAGFHEDCWGQGIEDDCYVVNHAVDLCAAPDDVSETFLRFASESDCSDAEISACVAGAVRNCGPEVGPEVARCLGL